MCKILSNTHTKESVLNMLSWTENLYQPNAKIEDIYRREG